jgi:hypothetical protein
MRSARAEPGDQLRLDDGLGEIVVGAGLQAGHDVLDRIPRREQNRVDVTFARCGAQLAAQRDAIHFRHFPIGDHQLEIAGGDFFERFLAVARDLDVVAGALEQPRHDQALRRLIVDEQDAPGFLRRCAR